VHRGTLLIRARKHQIIAAMGGACWDCGEDREPCLVLHHRWPDLKTGSHNSENGALWRKAITRRTWAEVWLCDLLCHNCHAMRHARA
jgi:hypothetical protein